MRTTLYSIMKHTSTVKTDPTATVAFAPSMKALSRTDVDVSSASATSDIVIANTMAIVTKTAPDALSTPNTASPVTKSMTVTFAVTTVNTVSVTLNATAPFAPTTANTLSGDSPPTLVDLEYFLEWLAALPWQSSSLVRLRGSRGWVGLSQLLIDRYSKPSNSKSDLWLSLSHLLPLHLVSRGTWLEQRDQGLSPLDLLVYHIWLVRAWPAVQCRPSKGLASQPSWCAIQFVQNLRQPLHPTGRTASSHCFLGVLMTENLLPDGSVCSLCESLCSMVAGLRSLNCGTTTAHPLAYSTLEFRTRINHEGLGPLELSRINTRKSPCHLFWAFTSQRLSVFVPGSNVDHH